MTPPSENKQHSHSLGFFVLPDNVEAFISALGNQKVVSKLLQSLLFFVEKITGLKTGLEVPELLISQKPEHWKHISTIRTLRELGYVEDWLVNIFPYPDEPYLHNAVVKVADRRIKNGKRILGMDGAGFSFFSQEETFPAAISEAVERWIFNNFKPGPNDVIHASYEVMQKKKRSALDIFSLAGIAPEARKSPPVHFRLHFEKTTPFEWYKGTSLTSQKPIFIPAQLITASCANNAHRKKGEPILRLPITNGMATHNTLEKAILAGALELIERDAFMITWLNKISPRSIIKESVTDSRIQNIFNSFNRFNLETHLLYLPTDMPVHVVLAVVIDRSGAAPAVTIGANAGFAAEETITKALAEAHATHLHMRAPFIKAQHEAQDFSYPDKNTIGHLERLLYWSSTDRIKDILFICEGKQVSAQELPSYTSSKKTKEDLNALVQVFRDKGLELAYAEVSEKKIRKTFGLRTVMVVAPELQPLHLEEALPYTWGKRLRLVPFQHNIQPAKKLHNKPHPFP